MKCIVCGRETEGSVSRTGTIWLMVCPECMEHENKVVEASLLGMAKVVTDLIHPSQTLDEFERMCFDGVWKSNAQDVKN